MRVKVLGAGAGGGFPQWNCACELCRAAREGDPFVRPRTQSSITVSPDGSRWILINASPDIRAQLAANPDLWPRDGIRDNRIGAIVLTDSQLDHVSGLLFMRENRAPLRLFGTEAVRRDLASGLPILNVLSHYCGTVWTDIRPDATAFSIEGFPTLRFTPVPVVSNAPPYSPYRDRPEPGHSIALLIEDRDTGKRLFYGPAIGDLTDELRAIMAEADLVLVEGTCWTSDELIALGISSKRSEDMGHLPLSGPDGLVAALARLERPRKILIHINNTNPILNDRSAEHRILAEAGIDVAHDTLDVTL